MQPLIRGMLLFCEIIKETTVSQKSCFKILIPYPYSEALFKTSSFSVRTFFIEESYVIATIIKTKSKYLKEKFTTFKEINIIKSILQNEFNKKNLDVCITSQIDNEFFTIYDSVAFSK